MAFRNAPILLFLPPWFCLSLIAVDPKINGIEPYSTNQVIVHFDTEARRAYSLEYSDNWCLTKQNDSFILGCATWKSIFSAPSIPFANHYVIVDSKTNLHRIYRLRVTP